MKKYLSYIPVALALLGLASCSQDRDPKYHAPVDGSFVLNAPAMQDQEIVLTEGHTLEFSCSQPDYGFAAAAAYSIDMALTEDFSESYSITPINPNSAVISISQSEVSSGFCQLAGIDSEESYMEKYPDGMPFTKIYFRATCQIPGYETSIIHSNVVSYNYLKPYFAVAVPGYIYLVGNVTGWTEPSEGNASTYANWRLFEPDDAIGSKIYTGVFELTEAPMFRFYTALTGWDADSYGYIVDDNATDFPEWNGSTDFTASMIKGKGAYNFPNFPGGEVTITVNMSDPSNMTVLIQSGAVEVFVPKFIYVIGSITDPAWMEPSEGNATAYEPYKLFNSKDAEGVYTGKFPVKAGDVYFRFAYELLGWDDGQWGLQEPDESTSCELVNDFYTSAYVKGKGSWEFSLTEDGYLELAVDTDSETISVNFVTD